MTTPRARRAPSRLTLGGALAALALLLVPAACSDSPTEASRPRAVDLQPRADLASDDFPFTATVTSGVPAFQIKQEGGGIAGRFEITNENSAAIALDGVSRGTGHALLAWNLGLGRAAVFIQSSPANTLPTVDASTSGLGTAMEVSVNNAASTASVAHLETSGTGSVLRVNHRGASGDLAVFQVGGTNLIRFSHEGTGYFSGGTKNKGADVAEAFEVEGSVRQYEPGDVLAISTRSDRTVEKSSGAYSTLVAGVYATQPGVLLTERDLNNDADDVVPLGVVGVIPTKVSAENGAIRRGDLLVTASMPGHVMRGTDRRRMLGATLGKALEEFTGPGTGVIRVLVNVK